MPFPADILAAIASHLAPSAATTLSPSPQPVLPLHLLSRPPTPATLHAHIAPHALPRSPPLTHLSLAAAPTHLTLAALTSTLSLLPPSQTPSSLDLSSVPHLTTLQALSTLLPLLPRLRVLRLASNPAIGGAAFFTLLPRFATATLTTLDVSHCPYISLEDTRAAFPALENLILSPDHILPAAPPASSSLTIIQISIPHAVASNDAASLSRLVCALTEPLIPRAARTADPAAPASRNRRPRPGGHPDPSPASCALRSQLAHAFLTTPYASAPRGLLSLAAATRASDVAALLIDGAAFCALLPRAYPPLAQAVATRAPERDPRGEALLRALRPRAPVCLASPVASALVVLAAARVDDVALGVLLPDACFGEKGRGGDDWGGGTGDHSYYSDKRMWKRRRGVEDTLGRAVAALFEPPAAIPFPKDAAEDDAMYESGGASGDKWCGNTVLVGQRPVEEKEVRRRAGRCLDALLRCGICVEKVPCPVLYHASRGGHSDSVLAMLKSRPGGEEVRRDCALGHAEGVRALRAAARRITERNERMETLLVTAARGAGDGQDHGALGTVKAILEVMDEVCACRAACEIASPISMREDVADAMVTALTTGHEPLARFIMDRRPDCINVIVSPRGNSRCALLSIARCVGRASPNEHDLCYMGGKLLDAALERHGHAGINNWLSTACVDRDGRSVLHFAACASDPKFARRLICLGSDVDKRDNDGMTPLCLAISERGSRPCLESLLEAKANVHVDIGNGRRPLHVAAAAKNGMAEALLMHHGANPLLGDDFNLLPIHLDPMLAARSSEIEVSSTPPLERCGSSQTLHSSCGRRPRSGEKVLGMRGASDSSSNVASSSNSLSQFGHVIDHRPLFCHASNCVNIWSGVSTAEATVTAVAATVASKLPMSAFFVGSRREDQFQRQRRAQSFTRNVCSFSSSQDRNGFRLRSRVGSCSTLDLQTPYLGSSSSDGSVVEDEDELEEDQNMEKPHVDDSARCVLDEDGECIACSSSDGDICVENMRRASSSVDGWVKAGCLLQSSPGEPQTM